MRQFGINVLLGLAIILFMISCEKHDGQAPVEIEDKDSSIDLELREPEESESELLCETKWMNDLTKSEYNGRKTGTKECELVFNYIIAELNSMGYEPETQEFVFRDSLKMRNIIVDIPGKSDSTIVIGAHYDGAVTSAFYPAANDNASGVAALLSIAKNIEKGKFSIKLCFWDGEEYTRYSAFNGSEYYVMSNDSLNTIVWYCNIDCCGRKDSDITLCFSEDLFSQSKRALTIVESFVHEVSVDAIMQLKMSSDYVSFLKRGISTIGWNDKNVLDYIHTPKDDLQSISVNKIIEVANATIALISLF